MRKTGNFLSLQRRYRKEKLSVEEKKVKGCFYRLLLLVTAEPPPSLHHHITNAPAEIEKNVNKMADYLNLIDTFEVYFGLRAKQVFVILFHWA